MSKLDEEIEAVDEILENLGLVRGEEYERLCKFMLNTGSIMQAFMMMIDDDKNGIIPFMQQLLTVMISAHADALGIANDELKEIVAQATAIQARLDAIKLGDI